MLMIMMEIRDENGYRSETEDVDEDEMGTMMSMTM